MGILSFLGPGGDGSGSLAAFSTRAIAAIVGQVSKGTSKRACPYCGAEIDLIRCDIVSAVRGAGAGARALAPNLAFDNLHEDEAAESSSSESDATTANGYRVLVPGRRDDEVWVRRTLRDELQGLSYSALAPIALTAAGPPSTIPRRLCEHCETLLPPELDTRATKLLAIAGINLAGKTHFLAQAFYEATRKGSLRPFGCSEFFPTESDATAAVLHNFYFARLQRDRSLFDGTQEKQRPKQLTFGVTVDGAPILLVTHDVAGEAMADSTRRATELSFLRRADALIFLLDPLEFDEVRRQVPARLAGPVRPFYQVDLLRQCLTELQETKGPQVPIRVVISKADLLTDYCGIKGLWQQPGGADWKSDLAAISEDVKRVLTELGEVELLHMLSEHERVTFHAISALGKAPDGQELVDAAPIRCSDPLAAALYGMAHTPAPFR